MQRYRKHCDVIWEKCQCINVLCYSVNRTVGVFWLNAAETWIDINMEDANKVVNCCTDGPLITYAYIFNNIYVMNYTFK